MSRAGALVRKAADKGATLAERHEAFEALVRLFQDMAVARAYAALGDFHLAEDAAQEAFVTAWRKLAQLREPDAFPGWLGRIVRTECNRLTRGKRVRTATLDADAPEPVSRGAALQSVVEAEELKRSVAEAVRRLPPAERVVTTLFYFDNRSHREIAQFLRVPQTTVAKRLHTARQRLKGLGAARLRGEFESKRPSRDMSFADKVRRGIFDDYLGRYRFEARPDLEVVITREGDRLYGEAAGQRNELFARRTDSERELRTREFDGRGEFLRDARGRVTHFVYYEFGREMGRAKKIS
ncbi:MAG TPA: sigma-70 family RNA polymerase sigma factor [Pyrinomonadaceae bacterium]|nr:sigma-70 family RNA polymerase sigma factor [Pyrinomonadaceae bacterium]